MSTTLHTISIESPIGKLFAVASHTHLYALDFQDKGDLLTSTQKLAKLLNADISQSPNDLLLNVKHQLEEYFKGTRKTFDIPTKTLGTDFQIKCWKEIQAIPYAHAISYGQQAHNILHPKAVRATGTANGHNRISIIIPCHRVVGANGGLGGYAGGIERKQWLLAHEQKWK